MKPNKTNNQTSSLLSKSDIEAIDMVQIHGGLSSALDTTLSDKEITLQGYCPNYNSNCVKNCGAK